ncbi:hypothetical protein GCM10011611_26300 [Aliidongia dinghuensis]|uniref:Uncharacterized protein n=1 Tax=Aliidongia dinghuensis TaxID=1867774 RepID=A0A8J2YTX6_9PROT|nr:hypothetical protein GCM10011611_26300 [Aliidongia dinghuensis]
MKTAAPDVTTWRGLLAGMLIAAGTAAADYIAEEWPKVRKEIATSERPRVKPGPKRRQVQ